ncbi:MATE family efflux transporter [uncultured Subdoligranulum sp.]|uniref:MATE family efflux transporter n=1 Tax=uncultured Subdoligranulum sp. TaxID=512298 RepID=UPI0026115AC5|nr:MATE family efflux transporter [uncultured Subdoligranulum sp.]
MNSTFMKEKPILPLLLSMALPMVVSMLVNALYNIVDSLFVAQISEDAMTALSLVFPMQNLVNAIAIGFGVGINAQIALHLGAGSQRRADTAATHGMLYSLLHGVLITIICIAIVPHFLGMFTTDPAVLELGITYATIAFSFSVVIMAALAFEKMFQAVGRMKVTMIALLAGSICNILLDPILIFGLGPFPQMGIAGAALATGIGQMLTLSIYLFFYRRTPIPVQLRRSCIKPDKRMDLQLYAIGIPAILNLALPSLLVSFLNSLLAAYSQSYVVVLGIYYKLQTFLYLPASGIVQGMRPLIGYNYGAGEHRRVRKIYEWTLALCAAILAAGTVVCFVFSEPLIGMFTSNPETLQIGQVALRTISLGFVISAVSVASSGALEGLGKGAASLVISLCRYVLAILPLAWFLCRQMGPTGVWHAFWITEIIAALLSAVVYHRSIHNRKKSSF